MVDVVDCLAEQHAELRTLVEGCSDTDWQRSTRCEGWDIGDVLLHLALSDELATDSARGELDSFEDGILGPRDDSRISVDDAAAKQVASERALGGAAIASRWSGSSIRLLAELGAGDPHRRVTWISGQFSMQTLATTRLAEAWIHTGDIASALGTEVASTDRIRHIARLAWRTIPYACMEADTSLSGPVALHLVGPSGDRWDFLPDDTPVTTISGSAVEFCKVAGRRINPKDTALVGVGPDADTVLSLVRTYAL
jgi:uncharacterized protein (TIGR03084 family)